MIIIGASSYLTENRTHDNPLELGNTPFSKRMWAAVIIVLSRWHAFLLRYTLGLPGVDIEALKREVHRWELLLKQLDHEFQCIDAIPFIFTNASLSLCIFLSSWRRVVLTLEFRSRGPNFWGYKWYEHWKAHQGHQANDGGMGRYKTDDTAKDQWVLLKTGHAPTKDIREWSTLTK